MLYDKNIRVTAVELDKRIIQVAQKYFNLNKGIQIIEDDARHALYSLNVKYDIIVMDLFNSEVTSSHVLSLEFFNKLKSLLSDGGFIFINTYGYLYTSAGKGTIALLNNLKHVGFNLSLCYSGNREYEDYRTFQVFATTLENKKTLYAAFNIGPLSLKDTLLSTDDKPFIEFANAEAGKRWRYTYLTHSYYK